MPANINPIFALTPKTNLVQCTSSYTDRTGAAVGLVDLITGSANGTKVTQIGIKVAGTSLAGNVLIFITDTAGLNPRLFDEILVSAISASVTTQSNRNLLLYSDLNLASGQKIQVGCTDASNGVPVNVFAVGGDF